MHSCPDRRSIRRHRRIDCLIRRGRGSAGRLPHLSWAGRRRRRSVGAENSGHGYGSIDFELLFHGFRRHRYLKNHVFTVVLQCFFRFWHIQNHVYFHLIFHGFWHAFGYILAHIFKTCSRIVFVYLFDDALRCLLDASGMPLGKFSTPWPPLGCLWAPILSCKTRLNRPLRPP